MADITAPLAIKHANEDVRPLSESLVAMVARGQFFLDESMEKTGDPAFPTVGEYFSKNLTGILQDGREKEQVSRLTGGDVALISGLVVKLLTLIDDPNNADAILAVKKATVQRPRVK